MSTKFDHCRLKLKPAQQFVAKHHLHCPPLKRHMFSTGVYLAGRPDQLLGVATVDVCSSHAWSLRPDHVEIRRLCTVGGDPNAASYLLATVTRACFAIGYRTIITYTQPYETGATLKACGYMVQRRKRMTLEADGTIKGGLVQWCRSRSYTPDDEDRADTNRILAKTHEIMAEWLESIEAAE